MARRSLALAGFLALLLAPAAASAGKTCFHDNVGGHFKLQGYKVSTKPGKFRALSGYYFSAGSTYPVSGAWAVHLSGDMLIGITAYVAYSSGTNIAITMRRDKDTGTIVGKYDTDGDGQGEDDRTWTKFPCKDADGG